MMRVLSNFNAVVLSVALISLVGGAAAQEEFTAKAKPRKKRGAGTTVSVSAIPPGYSEVDLFPFAMPTSTQCVLDIDLSQRMPLAPEVLGVNRIFMDLGDSLDNVFTASDPQVQELLDRQTPFSIRFPAGTFGNWYDWETDGFSIPDWDSWPAGKQTKWQYIRDAELRGVRFDSSGYTTACIQRQIAPVLVFNILYDPPAKCASQLQNRISAGVRPTWIELGNENSDSSQQGGNVGDEVEYVNVTRAITTALKAVDPNVKCAVYVPWNKLTSPNAWINALKAQNYYDGVILHPYLGVPADFYTDSDALKQILGGYRFVSKVMEDCATQFPGKKVLLSEWGIRESGGDPALPSFIQQLGEAEQNLAILRKFQSGQVVQSSIHQYLGNLAALYDFDGADTSHFKKRRKGIMYELMWEMFRGAELYAALPQSQLLRYPADPEYDNVIPAINAVAVRAPNGATKVLCVNKLPVEAALVIRLNGNDYTGRYEHRVFKEDVHIDRIYELNEAAPGNVTTDTGIVALPSFSINFITTQKPAQVKGAFLY